MICPNFSWPTRFALLMDEFPSVSSGAVSLKDFGFLDDWLDWGLWD
ncbi:MAG: hypothetical protein JKY01_14155 [Pseudomonadales bacterium]|nr:hypothetical protein [Pseudomonadales bacterium]